MKLPLLALLLSASFAAQAQNITTVNGKAVPKARAEALIQQVLKNGQARTPDLEKQAKDEVVRREVLIQEAERRGIPASADFKAQMELARQALLMRELQASFAKANPVSDADAEAEYNKVKAAQAGTEYRARHILVETEAEAIDLIKQLNGGAKFEDLASKSKDPGSAARGGDLDWANANSYVPEFSQAMVALKKGELTQNPVKSQFGYHVIRLEDTREAQFPPFADVKPQVLQRLQQMRWAEFQKKLFSSAKTDYKLD